MGGYFDNASTTYLYEQVIKIITDLNKNQWGNPSNLYTFGDQSKQLLNAARDKIAQCLKVDSEEIIFTSCSSESNALAIAQKNLCFASKYNHHDIRDNNKVILVEENFLEEIIKEPVLANYDDALYIHMLVNNETGEIFNIKTMTEQAKKIGINTLIDCTQALGNIEINLHDLGCDFASFSLHKVHGPKVGVLYISKEYQKKNLEKNIVYNNKGMKPLIFGSQEFGVRGGTEDHVNIYAGAIAIEKAVKEIPLKENHCEKLRKRAIMELKKSGLDYIVNEGKSNIPSILNISFKNISGDALAQTLNEKGFYVSTGSACLSGNLDPSLTLQTMNVPEEYIEGAIRLSFSLHNTEEEIVSLIQEIKNIILG